MIETLIEKYKYQIRELTSHLKEGLCSDYTQYRQTVAQIDAFEAAIDIAKKLIKDPDDEE